MKAMKPLPINLQMELISPAIAHSYLAANLENNRPVSKTTVNKYKRDILTGNWNPNTGESIKFDTKGRLIDGQHRLHAIIEAGKATFFGVMRGCDPKAFHVIDSGRSKSAATRMGVNKNISATITFLLRTCENNASPSNSELDAAITKWGPLLEGLSKDCAFRREKYFGSASVMAAACIASQVFDYDYVVESLRKLQSGDIDNMSRAHRSWWKAAMSGTGSRLVSTDRNDSFVRGLFHFNVENKDRLKATLLDMSEARDLYQQAKDLL